jgi:hypothetical protein
MTEEWKLIENSVNYEVSNYGEVRNKITMNILKTSVMGGYLALSLHISNKKVILKIHRLVAICFLVCPDETYIVNHKDGNKTNNHVENLEWVSRSENAKHAFRLGLNKGKKIKVTKYTLDDVFIREYDSLADAEKETGIFQTHISKVCRGERKTAGGYIWKYSDGYAENQHIPEGKIMDEFPNYIITNDGKVYNLKRKRFLISTRIATGYMSINLSNNKKIKTFNVHRLVALLFLDNPNNLPEVNHIDFDKTNNKIENLEWVSSSDNIKHNFSKKIK